MNTVPNTFLGLGGKQSAYENAHFVVLPVPYDSTTSRQPGTRNGPEAIITASQHVEEFDEELEVECCKAGIATLDPVEPNMDGPEAMCNDLFRHARRIVREGKFLFALGGEHSITAGLVRAVMTKYKKLSVLQIDAHGDLRDSYHGSRYSHACAMRRVVELGASVVPVGIRSLCRQEYRFMKRAGVKAVTARDCMMEDDWVERVLNALGETVYVTVDIDGFDPSCAPGTGTPEPGGLDWYEVAGLLGLVAAEKNIVAADIVEVMPLAGQVVTEHLAARLAYKLMGYVHMKG